MVILLKFLRKVHVSTVSLHKLSKKRNANFRYTPLVAIFVSYLLHFGASTLFALIIKAFSSNILSTVFNHFILSLALSDLLSALVSPFYLYMYSNGYRNWSYPTYFCKVNFEKSRGKINEQIRDTGISWYLRSSDDVKEIINFSIFSDCKLTQLLILDFLERKYGHFSDDVITRHGVFSHSLLFFEMAAQLRKVYDRESEGDVRNGIKFKEFLKNKLCGWHHKQKIFKVL